MFQKTYLINSNFYKQYHDSRSFMLNRLFKTTGQNETMRQPQASFIQMPPNNYIYNAYSNTIKPILVPFETRPHPLKKENIYERDFSYLNAASNTQRVKYKEIQASYYDYYSSHHSRPKVQNNFKNLIMNDSFSFKHAAEKSSKVSEIPKNCFVDKISTFGLKHNIEVSTPKINAYKQRPAKVSATVEKIYTQTRTKPIEKLMKIEAYNDTSAFKPVKHPNEIVKISASITPKGNQEIKINLKQNRLVQKAKIETKNVADEVSNLQPAYFQPIQPAGRLLLKKKLSQPRTELAKLLLSKNPRLPPPFSKTTKLYEDQKIKLTQIETKKSNNYKDLKSIGFKIFRENVYVKDNYEKFPHSILDHLIKKSKIEKETLKFENKSPSITFNVVSNRDNVSTTGKNHSETEILIDRYLHKQRA